MAEVCKDLVIPAREMIPGMAREKCCPEEEPGEGTCTHEPQQTQQQSGKRIEPPRFEVN